MRRAYICSPLSGNISGNIENAKRYARADDAQGGGPREDPELGTRQVVGGDAAVGCAAPDAQEQGQAGDARSEERRVGKEC